MWGGVVLVAAIATLGYMLIKQGMLSLGSTGHLPGIPAVGNVNHITVSQSTPQGSIGTVAMGPKDSLSIAVYDAPPGYDWDFVANGPLNVQSSDTLGTFTWSGLGGAATATASLVRPGAGTAPLATFTVAVTPAVY